MDLRNDVMSSINDRDLINRLIRNIQEGGMQLIRLLSFGSVLAILNPFLILIMLLLVIMSIFITQKAKIRVEFYKKIRKERNKAYEKEEYSCNKTKR